MPYYISGNQKIELKQSTSSFPVPRLPFKDAESPGEGVASPVLQPVVLEDPTGTQLLVADQVNADLSSLSDPQRQQFLQKHRARLVRAPSTWHPFYVLSPVDGDPFHLANALAEQEGLMAQPLLETLLEARALPVGTQPPLPQRHEEMLELQWGLRFIRAPQAWGVTQGSPEIKVAVIDCGVDLGHPDLSANLLDKGYDILNQTPLASPAPLNWANAHGTACAGIIAATGRHVLGVAPGCQLLPIRFVQFEHFGVSRHGPQHLGEAIRRAVELGASVISISFATWDSDVVHRAIREALSARRRNGAIGCVVVAGTGNTNGQIRYPAAYEGVLAVAAVDSQGKRWLSSTQGSCFGARVSVAAPGTGIWTTDLPGVPGVPGYATSRSSQGDYTWSFGGTSAACAFAAGAAALVLSANPQLSPKEVCHILQETASKPAGSSFPGGRNDELGHGIINAQAAVERARDLLRGSVA